MKKSTITLLLSLTCLATLSAAVACGDKGTAGNDTTSSVSATQETVDVTFSQGEGYTFVHELTDGKALKGETLTFTLKRSAFYTGDPVVYKNGEPISYQAKTSSLEWAYSVEMTEATEFTVAAASIRKDVSNMSGTGTMTDAYVVSKPVDLLYIAQQVNNGVRSYATAAYVLGNDIDCGGETLEVIGDGSKENSFFSGCFSCIVDTESGSIENRYTISNFKINTDDTNYVGLFGTVMADLSVESSGLFYGIRIDNFSVNASANNLPESDRSIVAGGLIGYGQGANLYLCDATNGEVNVVGDNSYFSFAGGLIGYQQGVYMSAYSAFCPSEIAYASVDVDVNILSGMALYAGGISGYLATNYPLGSTAFIHNSYATGSVSGALRSGGLVGGLGQYTSVGNCYATGNVFASTTQKIDDPLLSSTDYCYSYAGGLVGYAENDTIVNDSFYTGQTSATAASGNAYAAANEFVGGGDKAGALSAIAREYIVDSCLGADDINLSDLNFLTNTLGWQQYDWQFTANKLPMIEYDPVDTSVVTPRATLTIYYVAPDGTKIKVNGESSYSLNYFDATIQSTNAYVPMGNFFYNGVLDPYITADAASGVRYLSYGYFLDEACTQKVPYSYVAMKNITFYVGFADPTAICDTYTFVGEGAKPITLTFHPNGTVTYSDGETEQTSYYLYDGETVIIEGARLSRYYDGKIIVEEDSTDVTVNENFDMNRYSYYDYKGYFKDGALYLSDGVYFTNETPFVAKADLALVGEYYVKENTTTYYISFYGDSATVELVSDIDYSKADYSVAVSGDRLFLTNGTSELTFELSELKAYDEFKGVWTKTANVNKYYKFDGMGGWTYTQILYDRTYTTLDKQPLVKTTGTYTYDAIEGVLTLDNGVTASWKNGFLEINDNGNRETYYREESFVGTWSYTWKENDEVYSIRLVLSGIGKNGYGNAILTFTDGTEYELIYEQSETTGYICLYMPHEEYVKDMLFGYFTYDVNNHILASVLYGISETADYGAANLTVTDDYLGEWICNSSDFSELNFDGNGLYGFLGKNGNVQVIDNDGNETVVPYTLDSTMEGKFIYKGTAYALSFHEDDRTVTVTPHNAATTVDMNRKDKLANVDFVDLNGNYYKFDGKSTLGVGSFTIVSSTQTTYQYQANGENYDVLENGLTVGSIVKTDACYEVNINGNIAKLYTKNEFMGEWAISGTFESFTIGATNLKNEILATFKGNAVVMSYLSPTMLTFSYKDTNNMPITYYVYLIYDATYDKTVLVLSEYTDLYSGDYFICTPANNLYGEWKQANDGSKNARSISFDGVSSGYANGVAKISNKYGDTMYYYMIRKKGIMMWSQDLLAGRTIYYKVVLGKKSDYTETELLEQGAYVLGDRVFFLIEADGLYLTDAKDLDGNEYFFDGEGNLYVNGELKYAYKVRSYNSDNTASIHVTDLATGKKYEAEVDYDDANNITFTLFDEVIE